MASWDWKNDRRVQFAVGLAIVLVAAKWLFTGSLMSDVEVMRGQVTEQVMDEDGSLKSVPVPTSAGVISIAMDFLIGALVTIGAWVLNLGGLLVGRLTNSTTSPSLADESPPVSEDEKTRKLAIALAAAAQSNELDQLEALRIQLRLPMAMDELRDAYQAGDLTAAGTLNAELQTLIAGPKPVTAASKRKAGA